MAMSGVDGVSLVRAFRTLHATLDSSDLFFVVFVVLDNIMDEERRCLVIREVLGCWFQPLLRN